MGDQIGSTGATGALDATEAPAPPFGPLLRRYRRAAGLTQETLAERAHLSAGAIAALERGVNHTPQRETLALLADALALAGSARSAFEDAARPSRPARLRSATVPTNLPLALTSFVGRAHEQATVRGLLAEARLLTLTGAGGCGKTRLALEVARGLAGDPPAAAAYVDGVWLVELAALGDALLVPLTVAAALGLRERPGQPLVESVTAFLRPRAVLLLLDNCEHLLGACAHLAETVLQVCPRVTILATSREALRIGGEQPWRVPSLRLPDGWGRRTPERALSYEAVQLFAQRAQVVSPQWTLTAPRVSLVEQVCRRLDGIPLALELAAARLATLSLEQLAARLDDRFRWLTEGSRTALPRQRTLRATLDWSYELLSEPEGVLLQRLAVFAGGWTLEAAEAVCAGTDDGHTGAEVLDLLGRLVAQSLVGLEEREAGPRYRLLETVRQYAWEKLAATGEATQVQDRHVAWYLALAEQAAQRIGGVEREAWLERLEAELENLRAALAWSSRPAGRAETGLRLASALEDFWYIRGHVGEGRRWLEDLLDRSAAPPRGVRARALDVLALLVYYQGDLTEALRLFEAAYAAHMMEGQTYSATWALNYQAMVALPLGEYERARALLEQVLPVHREHGDGHGVGWALCYQARLRWLQGDLAGGAELYAQSLAVFEEVGDTFGVSEQLGHLAAVVERMGDYEQAQRLHHRSVQIRRVLKDKTGLAEAFEGLAAVAVAGGQPGRAAHLRGAASSLREATGTPVESVNQTDQDRTIAAIRAALDEGAFTAAWAVGRAMGLEEAIAYALQDGGTA